MGHIPNQHLDPLPILPRLFKIRLDNEVIEFFGLVVRMMYYPEEILVLENQSFYLFVRKRNC